MKNRLVQILAIALIVTGCKTETKNEGQSSDITYGKDGVVQNGTVDTRMGKLTLRTVTQVVNLWKLYLMRWISNVLVRLISGLYL
jgi:hypothetical protein